MSLRQEVVADECRCGRMSLRQDVVVAGTGRHSGGFLLRIMPPSLHPVPRLKPISSTILAVFVDETDFNSTLPLFTSKDRFRVGRRRRDILLCCSEE